MCSPILGAVVSAASALASAAQQAGVTRAQAQIARNNATVERRRAETETARERELQRRRLSARRARSLAAGVALEGSPIEVILEDIGDSELKIADQRFEREASARNFEAQASVSRAKARGAVVGGAFGAITPLIDQLK